MVDAGDVHALERVALSADGVGAAALAVGGRGVLASDPGFHGVDVRVRGAPAVGRTARTGKRAAGARLTVPAKERERVEMEARGTGYMEIV